SRRRHTRCLSDWSSDVCSSDLDNAGDREQREIPGAEFALEWQLRLPDQLGNPLRVVRHDYRLIPEIRVDLAAIRALQLPCVIARSEERRVGKECRTGRWRCH